MIAQERGAYDEALDQFVIVKGHPSLRCVSRHLLYGFQHIESPLSVISHQGTASLRTRTRIRYTLLQTAFVCHIHLATKQLFSIQQERSMIEKTPPRLQFYQEIHITFRPGLTPSHRAKHLHSACPVSRSDTEDLLTLLW